MFDLLRKAGTLISKIIVREKDIFENSKRNFITRNESKGSKISSMRCGGMWCGDTRCDSFRQYPCVGVKTHDNFDIRNTRVKSASKLCSISPFCESGILQA